MRTIVGLLLTLLVTSSIPLCLSLPEDLKHVEKSQVSPDLEFNWDDCGVTKGCYRSPAECSPSTCDVLVSWQESQDVVNFELSMFLESEPVYSKSHWIALGISETPNMNAASVISCLQTGMGQRRVEMSYNIEISNQVLNNNTLGIVTGSFIGQVADGKSVCKFTRVKTIPPGTPEGNLVFDLSSSFEYHFLLAYGELDHAGKKLVHSSRPVITPRKINVGQTEDIGGGVFTEPLVKAHATLMFAAWTLFSGIGILNARYFKGAWPSIEIFGLKLWFVIHRVCMSFVMALTLIGCIMIFIHVNGYSRLDTVTPSVLRSHPVLGIIVLVFVVINPLMAVFRPGPDASKRPLFNWGHRIVGESGRFLAVFNLMTGLSLPASSDIVEEWMFWTMVGVICFHLTIEIILGVRHFMQARQQDQEPLWSNEMINMDTAVKQEATEKTFRLETILLIVYSACVTSLTLSILIGIAIA